MKIPYGISNFKIIKEEGYYYVDKTMYLEKLEKWCSYIIYNRPRRFGKSLFTSMMYYYYDINSSDEFDTLFKDTYVYNNPTSNKNNYYVLRFDFSGIYYDGTDNSIKEGYIRKIGFGINEFLKNYNLKFEIDYSLSPAVLLTRFFLYFMSLKVKNKIYLIIDEYDSIINRLFDDKDSFIVNDFVKNFYARIKEYTSWGIVDRVFITGVCNINLDSLTSGFNIAKNITVDSWFNSMTALTHEEVKNILDRVPDGEKHFNIMLDNYDGYKFTRKEGELVFNPTLTMYYLKGLSKTGEEPEDLLDSNILSNYEQIKNIIKLGNAREIIMDIFDNGEISANLIVNFDANRRFSKDEIVSLLFYFGYLTINRNDYVGLVFNVPNKVIESVFNMYFLEMLRESNIEIDDNIIKEGIISMASEGNIDIITKKVSSIINQESFRDYVNINEYVIKHTYLTLLNNNNAFDIYSEFEVENGYIDLYFVSRSELAKYNIIIELKYLKIKDEDNYKNVYSEALEQINKYSIDKRINKINLRKYIVIFTGSDYTIDEIK